MEEEEEDITVVVPSKDKGDFPTFDEFVDDLCSWKDILLPVT